MGVPALSARRALLVLEYFEEVQSPLSLKAIAAHLNLPSSSTAALLKSLSDLDYLGYDVETRTYLPTLRLSSLGDWVPKKIMEDGVLDLVKRLQERTQETVVITTLNDLYVEFLDFRFAHRYASVYPLDENIKYPRGGAAVTCPMAWYLVRQYKTSLLERVYYRSVAKRIFEHHVLTWEMFLNRVESARQSKYILATQWPYDSSAVLATTVPALPFGRHIALAIGASTERMKKNLPALIDLVDSELAQLPNAGRTPFAGDAKVTQRVVEIDAHPGFLRVDAY